MTSIRISIFSTVVRCREEIIRPHVICLSENGQPVTLLVGRLEQIPLECAFGYKILYRPTVRSLTIVYGGHLGDRSEQCVRQLVRELMDALSRKEADVVNLNHVNVESPLYRHALDAPNWLCRDSHSTANIHWQLVPESLDALLQTRSAKTRSSLRRHVKSLEKKFKESLKIECYQSVNDLELLMEHLELITATTYQRGLGVGLTRTDGWRELFELQLSRNWLSVYVLYLEGRPCAYTLGSRYRRQFVYGIPGFDPAYQKHGIGKYLLLKVIEDLSGDP